MAQYMLMLHDTYGAFADLPEADMLKILQEYAAWSQGLREKGQLRGGEKLKEDAGRILRRVDGRTVVTDGPFAEAREILGGFFVIEAADYAEACRIAGTCPHMTHGARIEVREIHIFG